MTGDQGAIFPPPPPEVLRLPRNTTPGSGPVKYTGHTGRGVNHRCDDCLEIIHEWHTDGQPPPPPPIARTATYTRTQGGKARILCAGHKQLRQELEARR